MAGRPHKSFVGFLESYFNAVSDLCLYGNFVCHVTTLQQAGLITQETMVDVIAQMQGKIDSKSTRGPNTDPMTDLALRFPTLELITDNRGSKDRTLCEKSLKGTEEGRPWDLPEIVSIDTNYDAMTERRTRSEGI